MSTECSKQARTRFNGYLTFVNLRLIGNFLVKPSPGRVLKATKRPSTGSSVERVRQQKTGRSLFDHSKRDVESRVTRCANVAPFGRFLKDLGTFSGHLFTAKPFWVAFFAEFN